MNRIFIDMDGVLVDFEGHCKKVGLPGKQVKTMVGAYRAMKPIPGALEAVEDLLNWKYEVWVATKPPTEIFHAYSEKAEWIATHLPKLTRSIIMTHDKGLLGDSGDFLIDDRPHKANCMNFRGTLIPFIGVTWHDLLFKFYKGKIDHGPVQSG